MQDGYEVVAQVSSDFTRQWNALVASYPQYRLDGEWNSIGIIDRILFPLRGKQQLNAAEQALVFSTSCYLAQIVQSAWKCFPDSPDVSVTVRDSSRPSVVVSMKGGVLLNNTQQQTVDVFDVLVRVLAAPSSPLAVYREFYLSSFRESNLLSPVMAGIVSAASPFTKGPILQITAEKQITHELPIVTFIAQSLARSFERLYPMEEVLRSPEFFFRVATLPPDYDDGPALLGQLVSAWKAISERTSETAELERLSGILARAADDLLAKVGTVILFGLQKAIAPEKTATLVESLGVRASRFRHAVYSVRRQQGSEGNWAEMLEGDAKHWLDLDIQLGLSPLITFPLVSVIELPVSFGLAKVLASGLAVESTLIASVHEFIEGQPAALWLQFARLHLVAGDPERARQALADSLQAPGANHRDCQFAYCALLAEVELCVGADVSVVDRLLEQALAIDTQDFRGRSEVLSLLLRRYLAGGKLSEIDALTQKYTETCEHSMTLRLVLASIAIATGDLQRATEHGDWLYRVLPHHPEVFSLFTSLLRRL